MAFTILIGDRTWEKYLIIVVRSAGILGEAKIHIRYALNVNLPI